ncbi:hypothetical protein E2C01_073674 [Portunus trituberculatus]|uniref:Uncharacterized protein n=1 Tax=Portunus trituberculatus TaxID=210409 RepID=A0A5B7I1C0_PORTR|nr:hypothetical protein [Portunus trituberculatus]
MQEYNKQKISSTFTVFTLTLIHPNILLTTITTSTTTTTSPPLQLILNTHTTPTNKAEGASGQGGIRRRGEAFRPGQLPLHSRTCCLALPGRGLAADTPTVTRSHCHPES